MKILITSDWHLDYWRSDARDPLVESGYIFEEADALILAGDLAEDPLRTWPSWLEWIGRRIDPAKVILVPGNHDYWGHRLGGDNELRAIVEAAGMTFAQKRAIVLGSLRFLCCTLWTDFRLLGPQAEGMADARWMEDYARIARDAGGDLIAPADTAAVHRDHLAWLTRAIAAPHDGRTVIVTHHLPSATVAGPVGPLSPVFASDLDDWILRHRPDLWLCGHSHRRFHGRVGPTAIRDVSLGYPWEVRDGRETDLLLRGLIDTDLPELLVY